MGFNEGTHMRIESLGTFHIDPMPSVNFNHAKVRQISFGPLPVVGEAFFFDAAAK